MNIVLITPRRHFIANHYGLGYQIPLGLVLIAGPLIDLGHQVMLIDNDKKGYNDEKLTVELSSFHPDCILIGHTASTAAHDSSLNTAKALRKEFPHSSIIYGGVFPSYAAESILQENQFIDFIVRGEGEETIVELMQAIPKKEEALANVKGITWRNKETIVQNEDRPAIKNLDLYRPAWELVDWNDYSLFGFGRSAGMQLSRGCPLTCTYCGQWDFWKKWRHRSVDNFVGELKKLVEVYKVKIIWLADENFGANKKLAKEILEKIIQENLDVSINLNMTAADVVRQADIFHLYKQAGVDNIVMGIESLENSVVSAVNKNNPFEISKEAVRICRENNVVSLVNVIYGLEEETYSSVFRTYRRLLELDADILNACYITPHFWTQDGKNISTDQIIQPDQQYWTYRNQIIDIPTMSPTKLFFSVKMTELFFHLRPKAILRIFFSQNKRYQKVMKGYMATGIKVIMAEMKEFLRLRKKMTKIKS
jgi:anaerobic magnesium-protoporphyrin IX monomethyl ester cyclase